MKIFRSITLICSLFISFSFFAQANDSIQSADSMGLNLYTSHYSSIDQPIGLKKLDIQKDAPSLVLYNQTTNLYDIYSNVGNGYRYSGSNSVYRNKSNFFTNLFLGNDSFAEQNTLIPTRTFLLDEDVNYIVRDSFNPNGAANFSEAVLGGVLGLLFD